MPRVGYFTSSVFLNQWSNHVDNEFRVPVNQALISSLHLGFVPTEPTNPIQTDALDTEHSESNRDCNSDCFGCHCQLDPMRMYFARNYSADYRLPTNEEG